MAEKPTESAGLKREEPCIPYPPTSPFELISIRAMYTCHLTLWANVFIEQVTAA